MKSSEDRFSFSEYAVVGGFTKRAFQYLNDENLMPAGEPVWTLKRCAAIGTIMSCGVPLVPAGRIVKATLQHFNQYDGELPSGLPFLARKLPDTALPKTGELNDFWYHRSLIDFPEIYTRGDAMRNDVVLEIVESELLFLRYRDGLRSSSPFDDKTYEADFVGWIEGWDRGSEVSVRLLASELRHNGHGYDDSEKWSQVLAAVDDRRRNFVGMLSANLSLGIRNGLDRLHDHRSRRRTKDDGRLT